VSEGDSRPMDYSGWSSGHRMLYRIVTGYMRIHENTSRGDLWKVRISVDYRSWNDRMTYRDKIKITIGVSRHLDAPKVELTLVSQFAYYLNLKPSNILRSTIVEDSDTEVTTSYKQGLVRNQV
jgi:hypothetical protein